jgi:threonine/homoserine/homoserine lactone efflux protein
MSPVPKGIAAAVGFMTGSLAAMAMLTVGLEVDLRLSNQALSSIAQIGATLLIAYAVETSWFIKQSRIRDSGRENWVGFVTGVGISSAFGIAFAVALINRHGSPSFLESAVAMWTLFSTGFLALLVALLPYFLYEWVHAINTEYPDE